MKILSTIEELHKKVQYPARRAERPVHMVYFLLVATETHATYGMAAAFCVLLMILSIGEHPTE